MPSPVRVSSRPDPSTASNQPLRLPRSGRSSRLVHRADLVTTHPGVALTVTVIVVAALLVVALTGFDESLQFIFCTICAAATVVMVFVLQHTQRRSQQALQLKLDELLRALPGADDRIVRIEAAGDAEIDELEANSLRHHDAIRSEPHHLRG
jgi:low affinity Fe/Cu permease